MKIHSFVERHVRPKHVFFVLLGIILIAGVLHMPPVARAGFDDSALDTNSPRVQRVARRASLIFVGTVTGTGTRPNFWSGFIRTDQSVTYAKSHVIKGTLAAGTIDVQHLVVNGSRNANSTPGLNTSQFATGQKLIVIVGERAGRYFDLDEDFGTFAYSANNQSTLTSLMIHRTDFPITAREGLAK